MESNLIYSTEFGQMFHEKAEDFLNQDQGKNLFGKINLIFTSPPFPLNRKKKYGNLIGKEYIDWFSSFASIFSELLTNDGSIVIEIGNSWEKGRPTMSTLGIETLLNFQKKGKLHLCQQFIWNNPAKLPSPAQWVNVERIRVKDGFTHVWWMSKVTKPKASNRNVLKEYSPAMKKLLKTQKYNSGQRPSEHVIGDNSFLTNNKGSIPSNVLTVANTSSNSRYLNYCRERQIEPHPARMPIELSKFFIKFLTNPNDLVFDPFAGSNTTGAAAEELGRKWISIEPNMEYIVGSKGRFNSVFE